MLSFCLLTPAGLDLDELKKGNYGNKKPAVLGVFPFSFISRMNATRP